LFFNVTQDIDARAGDGCYGMLVVDGVMDKDLPLTEIAFHFCLQSYRPVPDPEIQKELQSLN
jgi:hypothetical protein